MIAYLDSSVLARTFLPDEPGHEQAADLIEDPDVAAVTWQGAVTEVTGALVRADRAGRASASVTLPLLGALVGADGAVTVVDPPSPRLHPLALGHARSGLHALDAYHLAVAEVTLSALAEPGERVCFATRDSRQAGAVRDAAARLGFDVL